MDIEKDIEELITEIETDNSSDLYDLCLCLIRMNQIRKILVSSDDKQLKRAIDYAKRRKRNDLAEALRLIRKLSIIKKS